MAYGAGRNWRLELIFAVLMLAVPVLAGRQVYLVLTQQAKAQSAQDQMWMRVPVPGRPGNIFGRARHRHILLAGSTQVPSCYADPVLLMDRPDLEELARRVSAVLGVPSSQILSILRERRDNRFAWLARQITSEQVQAVRELGIRGVDVQMEWRREYPQGPLGSSVLGFRLKDGLPGGGVEMAQNTSLAATDGMRVVLADALRRPFQTVYQESRLPIDGRHVYLCLDVVIQDYLEQAVAASVERFGAKGGVGVVVDPRTGDILAMTSLPSFDPNAFSAASDEQRTNNAITVPYEPGSVFKPLMAAAAVEQGVVSFDTMINCENGTYVAPRGGRISDHGQRYGLLSVCDVVVHSSNIGMAKVGERLGNRAMYDAVRRFGFGDSTGLGMPGESPGIVRDAHKWDGYSMRRVPFGQEVSVTTLQLAMAFAALANGGVLMRPRLVEMVNDPDGQVVYHSDPQPVRPVVSEATARGTVEAMHQVVLRGTGKACRMNRWSSFGKTGTAQIAGPGGYEEGAYTGSFVGAAPVDQPRVLCLISIYWPNHSKGYYGATVAAPYVKQVLEQTLEYLEAPPDLPREPPAAPAGAAPRIAASAGGSAGRVEMNLSRPDRD